MKKNSTYFKWGLTILIVIFISILLVVIFTDLPGFFDVIRQFFRLLAPLWSGIVIAFLLNPIVKFVDKRMIPLLTRKCPKMKPVSVRRWSRALGVILAFLFAVVLVYAFCAMLLPQLYDSIAGIVANAEDYYRGIEKWATNLLKDMPQVQEYVESFISKAFSALTDWFSTKLLSDIRQIITTVTTSVFAVIKGATNLIIGLAASVYMLLSKDLFRAQSKKFLAAVCSERLTNRLYKLGRTTYRVFNGFVIGKIIDSAIIGVLCYVGMLLLKMPYPALIATVIGITNVIPFFGPIIGAIPSGLLILLVNPLQAFYFVIFVLVLQQLDGNVIGPKILGNTVGISGFWVLVSITIATSLFGFAGMLLGVPVFAVIYELVSDAVGHRLGKKNLPVETEYYQDIQNISQLPDRKEEPSESSRS